MFLDLSQRSNDVVTHPLILAKNSFDVPVSMIHRGFDATNGILPKSSEELEQEVLFLEFSRGRN